MSEASPAEPLELLCEDGPLLAVNKPAGLLTQGVPQGLPTLEATVRAYLKQKYGKPGNVYLGIPHRLDRPTSGVVIFARNSKAAARLAEQFQLRQVEKTYLAIVEAVPEPAAGTLRDWLLKDAAAAHVTVVPEGTATARDAILDYETLTVLGDRALLRLRPQTGRMHQIRVQLASRGWPVLGDVQYGGSPLPGTAGDGENDSGPGDSGAGDSGAADSETEGRRGLEQIALHAWQLSLFHPIRYDRLTLIAPLPVVWRDWGIDPAELANG